MHIFFFFFVEKTEITATPYNGQVRLEKNDYKENIKPLMMHLNIGGTAEWGHVCLPKQLDAGNRTMVADTVCRQLGYTNSLIIIDDTKYVTFMSLQLPIRNEIKSTSYTL